MCHSSLIPCSSWRVSPHQLSIRTQSHRSVSSSDYPIIFSLACFSITLVGSVSHSNHRCDAFPDVSQLHRISIEGFVFVLSLWLVLWMVFLRRHGASQSETSAQPSAGLSGASLTSPSQQSIDESADESDSSSAYDANFVCASISASLASGKWWQLSSHERYAHTIFLPYAITAIAMHVFPGRVCLTDDLRLALLGCCAVAAADASVRMMLLPLRVATGGIKLDSTLLIARDRPSNFSQSDYAHAVPVDLVRIPALHLPVCVAFCLSFASACGALASPLLRALTLTVGGLMICICLIGIFIGTAVFQRQRWALKLRRDWSKGKAANVLGSLPTLLYRTLPLSLEQRALF